MIPLVCRRSGKGYITSSRMISRGYCAVLTERPFYVKIREEVRFSGENLYFWGLIQKIIV